MRTREKILIAVVVAALVLGGVIVYLLQSGGEVEANYTRWLFARNLRQFLSSPMAFLFGNSDPGQSTNALFYGLLAGFALIVMIIVLKIFRDSRLMEL